MAATTGKKLNVCSNNITVYTGNHQKRPLVSPAMMSKYEQIVIIGDHLYMPFLEHLKSPQVLVFADQELRIKDVKGYLSERKECLEWNKKTLFLLVVGIYSIADLQPLGICQNSRCRRPISGLRPMKIPDAPKYVATYVTELFAHIKSLRPLLKYGSKVALLPPVPVSLISTNLGHNKLHQCKRQFPEYMIDDKFDTLSRVFTIWANRISCASSSSLMKCTKVLPLVLNEFSTEYMKIEVMKCSATDRPAYNAWKEVIRYVVDCGLKETVAMNGPNLANFKRHYELGNKIRPNIVHSELPKSKHECRRSSRTNVDNFGRSQVKSCIVRQKYSSVPSVDKKENRVKIIHSKCLDDVESDVHLIDLSDESEENDCIIISNSVDISKAVDKKYCNTECVNNPNLGNEECMRSGLIVMEAEYINSQSINESAVDDAFTKTKKKGDSFLGANFSDMAKSRELLEQQNEWNMTRSTLNVSSLEEEKDITAEENDITSFDYLGNYKNDMKCMDGQSMPPKIENDKNFSDISRRFLDNLGQEFDQFNEGEEADCFETTNVFNKETGLSSWEAEMIDKNARLAIVPSLKELFQSANNDIKIIDVAMETENDNDPTYKCIAESSNAIECEIPQTSKNHGTREEGIKSKYSMGTHPKREGHVRTETYQESSLNKVLKDTSVIDISLHDYSDNGISVQDSFHMCLRPKGDISSIDILNNDISTNPSNVGRFNSPEGTDKRLECHVTEIQGLTTFLNCDNNIKNSLNECSNCKESQCANNSALSSLDESLRNILNTDECLQPSTFKKELDEIKVETSTLSLNQHLTAEFEHLVFLGTGGSLNLLPDFSFCQFSKWNLDHVVAIVNLNNKLNELNKRKVKFIILSDITMIGSKEVHPMCLLKSCADPVHYVKRPSIAEIAAFKIQACLTSVQIIISNIKKVRWLQSNIFVAPFTPNIYSIASNICDDEYHSKMHVHMKKQRGACFLENDTKEFWADNLATFGEQWNKLSHTKSLPHECLADICHLIPITWKDICTDSHDSENLELSKWQCQLLSLAKKAWFNILKSPTKNSIRISNVVPSANSSILKESVFSGPTGISSLPNETLGTLLEHMKKHSKSFSNSTPSVAPQLCFMPKPTQVNSCDAPSACLKLFNQPVEAKFRVVSTTATPIMDQTHILNKVPDFLNYVKDQNVATYSTLSSYQRPNYVAFATSLDLKAFAASRKIIQEYSMSSKADLKSSVREGSSAKSLSVSYNERSHSIKFEKLFLIGPTKLLHPLEKCKIRFEMINFSFTNFDDNEIQSLTNRIGVIPKKSACCLAFDLSIVANKSETLLSCKNESCQSPLDIHVLKSNSKITESTEELILNKIGTISRFLQVLSKFIPIILLPIVPARVYCTNETKPKHKVCHTLSDLGFYVGNESSYLWNEAIKSLMSTWCNLMEENNNKYSANNSLSSYQLRKQNAVLVLDDVCNFVAHWTVPNAWKTSIEIFLFDVSTQAIKNYLNRDSPPTRLERSKLKTSSKYAVIRAPSYSLGENSHKGSIPEMVDARSKLNYLKNRRSFPSRSSQSKLPCLDGSFSRRSESLKTSDVIIQNDTLFDVVLDNNLLRKSPIRLMTDDSKFPRHESRTVTQSPDHNFRSRSRLRNRRICLRSRSGSSNSTVDMQSQSGSKDKHLRLRSRSGSSNSTDKNLHMRSRSGVSSPTCDKKQRSRSNDKKHRMTSRSRYSNSTDDSVPRSRSSRYKRKIRSSRTRLKKSGRPSSSFQSLNKLGRLRMKFSTRREMSRSPSIEDKGRSNLKGSLTMICNTGKSPLHSNILEKKLEHFICLKTTPGSDFIENNQQFRSSNSSSFSPSSKNIKDVDQDNTFQGAESDYLADLRRQDRLNDFDKILESVRDPFEEEYKEFQKNPELHPYFKDNYDIFVQSYKEQFGRGNKEHMETLWNRYWNSKFQDYKTKAWNSRKQNIDTKYKALLGRFLSPQKSLSSEIISPAKEQEGRFDFEEALSVLEKVCDKTSFCGNAVKVIIQACKDLGTTTQEAYRVFADSGNALIIDIVLNKVKKLNENATGDISSFYKKAIEYIPKILDEAKNACR